MHIEYLFWKEAHVVWLGTVESGGDVTHTDHSHARHLLRIAILIQSNRSKERNNERELENERRRE